MSNINVNNITPLAGTTGTVSISGSLFVSGNIAADGNLTLGNENTDTITVSSEFTSSLIPDVDNAFDLGTDSKRWRHIYTVSSSIDTLIVSGGNTFTNWGNFKNRFPQNNRYFTVTTDPSAPGGWKHGNPSGASGSAPHLHLQLSGSGAAGIGLLNPEHTWHVSSSGYGKALYVDGVSALTGLISSSLIPNNDVTWDLGSNTYKWNNLYVHTILGPKVGNNKTISISSSINISGSITPSVDDAFDLGASGTQWKDLYVDGIAYIDQIGTGGDFTNLAYINSASINVLHLNVPGGNVSGSVIPMTDDTYDLGSSTYQWKDLYIDGTANIDILEVTDSFNMETGVAAITNLDVLSASINVLHLNVPDGNVSGSVIPMDDDTYDLGSSTFEWRDLYLDGTAYIDTAQITTITGSTTIESASINVLTVTSNVSSSLIPSSDGGADTDFDLGSSTHEWNDLYIDGEAYIDTIYTDQYIYHEGDTDTYIRFQDSQVSLITSGSGLIVSQSQVQMGGGIDGGTHLGTSTLNVTPHRYGGTAVSRNVTASIHVSGALTHLRLENLPTDYATAAAFGSGSLWRSGSTAGGHGNILAVV